MKIYSIKSIIIFILLFMGLESNAACGQPKEINNDETALYFNLDLSESYEVLEALAKAHPEQALKFLMYSNHLNDTNEQKNDLRYSKSTSSVIPTFEFFQLASQGIFDEMQEKQRITSIESTTTRLENNVTLLIESWATLLPNGNIKIISRSVIADEIFQKLENNEVSDVQLIPKEILAETVAVIEPIENENYLYKILSLKW